MKTKPKRKYTRRATPVVNPTTPQKVASVNAGMTEPLRNKRSPVLRAVVAEWEKLRQEQGSLERRLKVIQEELVPLRGFIHEQEPNLIIISKMVNGPA